MWRLFFLLISFNLYAGSSCPLQDGDLVFIKSQSEQSKLLKLTTGSEWTHVGLAFKNENGWEIIEAVGPVKWTSLYSFVRRSKDLAFNVRRVNNDFDPEKLKEYTVDKLGRDYDLIFSWDQERWYCTELVWKAFKKVSGDEIGMLEKIGDLKNIDSPIIRQTAAKRFASYGQTYNHEEWKKSPVITPITMMNSVNLEDVADNKNVDSFTDCLRN